jgi:hypothetical protein
LGPGDGLAISPFLYFVQTLFIHDARRLCGVETRREDELMKREADTAVGTVLKE